MFAAHRPWRIVAIAVALCASQASAAPIPLLSDAIAQCAASSVDAGTCQPYPSTGICASFLPENASVYIPTQLSVAYFENAAVSALQLVQTNKAVAGPGCFQKLLQLVCVKNFLECVPSPVSPGVEDLPVLVCQSFCTSVWSTCRDVFHMFWLDVIGGNYAQSPLPNCANGGTFNASWGAEPQPPDVIGGRNVPKNYPAIAGLQGIRQFPLHDYVYAYQNASAAGAKQSLTCSTPPNQVNISDVTLPVLACPSPLVMDDTGQQCVMPCPFSVFDETDLLGVYAAYTTPAILGFLLCCLVLLDSLWLIGLSYGWQERMMSPGSSRFLPNLNLRSKRSANGPQSWSINPSAHSDRSLLQRNANTSGNNASASTGHAAKKPVQTSTWYAAAGSLLGMLYFVLGPLGTLMHGSSISCGADTIDLFVIGQGAFQIEPDACIAQRCSIFVLHAIFNLVMNSMVRVYVVVRGERMSERNATILNVVLDGWCVGEPLLAILLAFYLDALSTNVFEASVQLSRQSAVCMVRLTSAAEWVLLYVPIIVTGCVVMVVSYLIAKLLVRSRRLVAKNKQSSSNDLAMRLLIKRLVGLGLITFATLVVVIASSVSYTLQLSKFSPALVTYLQCVQSVGDSLPCVDCNVWRQLAEASSVTPGTLGTQLAGESMIVVIFAGFFFAQTVARLYRQRVEALQNIKAGVEQVRHRGRMFLARMSRQPMPPMLPTTIKPPPGLGFSRYMDDEHSSLGMEMEATGNPVFEQLRHQTSDTFEYRSALYQGADV